MMDAKRIAEIARRGSAKLCVFGMATSPTDEEFAAPPSPAVSPRGKYRDQLSSTDEFIARRSGAVQNAVPEVEGLVKGLRELCAEMLSGDPHFTKETRHPNLVDRAATLIAAQAEELRVSKDKRADCLERQLIIAQDDLATERAAKEQAEAALRAAEELLRQVMAEGVEFNGRKYALIQMSHALRAEIRAHLDAAKAGDHE